MFSVSLTFAVYFCRTAKSPHQIPIEDWISLLYLCFTNRNRARNFYLSLWNRIACVHSAPVNLIYRATQSMNFENHDLTFQTFTKFALTHISNSTRNCQYVHRLLADLFLYLVFVVVRSFTQQTNRTLHHMPGEKTVWRFESRNTLKHAHAHTSASTAKTMSMSMTMTL